MAVRFSEEQVLKATAAQRLRPGARASYEAISTDTRALVPGALFVALRGDKFDGHRFLPQAAANGASGAIVEESSSIPGLPQGFALYAVKNTLWALGGLARFHRARFDIPVGAVTGSNGKTTTKEMVAAILETRGQALKTEGNLNNEVGVPLTLFRLGPEHKAAVIEMGMNAPGEIERLTRIAQPNAGVITVVQAAHLGPLGSVEGVARAKGELFHALGPNATAVVNVDEPLIVSEGEKSKKAILSYGRSEGAEVLLESVRPLGRAGLEVTIRHAGSKNTFPLHFLGEHNAHNATAAFALCLALGFRPSECAEGLTRAKPYSRRLNLHDTPEGFSVLDDCYNANPASVLAALDTLATLGGRPVAVLGDMLELGPTELEEHQRVGAYAAKKARLVAFFGPRSVEGHRAASELEDRAAHFTEVEPLVAWLRERLRPEDVVLVKASRGMQLERVVNALVGSFPGAGGH